MATKDEWLALARRCEEATMDDREIDRAIHDAAGVPRETIIHFGLVWNGYTRSIDAITALIERELPALKGRGSGTGLDDIQAFVYRTDMLGLADAEKTFCGHARTEALARCAAFCRAKAALAGMDNEI